MDKRKVINAYRSGIVSLQECAQILGLDNRQMSGLVNDPRLAAESAALLGKRSVNS